MEITSDALHNFRNHECLTFYLNRFLKAFGKTQLASTVETFPTGRSALMFTWRLHFGILSGHTERGHCSENLVCIFPDSKQMMCQGDGAFPFSVSFRSFYSHAVENVSCSSERGQVSSVPMPLKFWKGSHVLVQGLSVFAFLSPINYKHLFYGTWKD